MIAGLHGAILLRLLSLPYVRKHGLRTLLTAIGVVLGVAVFVGMHTANQSVLRAFYRTVDRIAGATQLQVTAGETGFPEEVLDKVQSLSGVRVAVPVIEATVNTGLAGQGNLLILGVDMTGDRSLRDYDLENDEDAIDDPLVFLAQPDSIVITRAFAADNHLKINARIPMDTMEGKKQFTVRGIMKAGGMASAFGGNLAVMDVYGAQKVFGRGRTFDRIDLAVTEGASVGDVQRQLSALLGSGYQVEAPSARGAQFESLSKVYAMSANITSAFALFIGMFIIYNTFQIAVTQRRTEIGILRALGATRGQIRTLFLGESLVLGGVGAVAGVWLGLLIARSMAAYIGGLLMEVYGVAQRVDELALSPLLIAAAVGIGMVTSLVAAFLPARAAASVDPVKALQKGRSQMISAGESRFRRLLALAALAVAVMLVLTDRDTAIIAAFGSTVVAALLLAPSLTLWLSRMLRPVLARIRPVEGALAADSLIQAPRRTSGAVAALMLSLSLVISLGGLGRASYDSIRSWLDSAFNPELFVSSSESITQRSFRFPGSMGDEIASLPGVEEVQRVRSPRVVIRGEPAMLIAIEIAGAGSRIGSRVVAGKADEMTRLAAAGKGVIAADNFAIQRGFKLGDTIEIPTPDGALRLPIVGITVDYSDQRGSFLIDRSVYTKYFHDDTVNVFRVYVKKGIAPDTVRRSILERFGSNRRVFVLRNQELKDFVLRLTDQWFGLTYVQIFVAVIVAILGIVNSLTVSITDRRRELGVLQAVGALRLQVRHTIWMEAVSIGVVGLVLGLLLGAASLYFSLQIGERDLGGFRLAYQYPFGIAAGLAPVILAAALLSALGPAESAVRGSLVEALEYE